MASATMRDTAGVISAHEIYSLNTFYKLSGMGEASVRACRRNGLRVRRIGARSYIAGADFLEYLQQAGRVVNADGTLAEADAVTDAGQGTGAAESTTS